MAGHPDLEAEQAHIDHAYRRLEAMRANAAAMLRDALGQASSNAQALTERDVMVRTTLNRLEQLQLGREALGVGRIGRRRQWLDPGRTRRAARRAGADPVWPDA